MIPAYENSDLATIVKKFKSKVEIYSDVRMIRSKM